MKQIHTILHDHLNVKKFCVRWILHNLTLKNRFVSSNVGKYWKDLLNHQIVSTISLKIDSIPIYSYESQTKSTVCIFQNELELIKIVRSRNVLKKMICSLALFFQNIEKLILILTFCLLKLIKEMNYFASRLNDRIYDEILGYLKSQIIELMSHCPHRFDLSLNDFFLVFFLFWQVKN